MDPDQTIPKPQQPKKSKKRIILASILFVGGFLLLSAGASIFIYNMGTDREGYTYSNIHHVNTTTYAFILYMNEYKISTWGFLGAENIAQIKFIVNNLNPSKELFTGYATTQQSEPYRKSFRCEFPIFWRWFAEPYYAELSLNATTSEGAGAPAFLPQSQTFWKTSAQSFDTATMTYLPLHEQHIWFIMNSDGSQNITADIQIGFKSPILAILPYVCIPLGLLLLVGGIMLLRRKKTTS
ncbi:MAG: hypothetical protein JW840_08625 [Candidatus Thermoplasmatota archaeon]|nr:hypothetical protein [Candidatus Thermoplasmatota archaeon]